MGRVLVCSLLLMQTARATPGEEAAASMRELRWRDARKLVDRALERGGLDRESWLELQRDAAEIAVVLDGPEAAEAAFRRLLVVDPEQAPPTRRGPVVMAPFERARRWVEQHGSLKVSVQAPPQATGDETPIEVRVAGDSLALVAGARVRLRGAGGFARLAGATLSARLPTAGDETLYFVEVVDEHDNVLGTAGSADEPLRLRRAPPPPERRAPPPPEPPPQKPPPPLPPPPPRPASPRHVLRDATIGVGLTSLVILGVGIGLDVSAVNEYDALKNRCAPACTDSDLSSFRLERDLGYTAYALAAGGAAATLILLVVDLTRRPPR